MVPPIFDYRPHHRTVKLVLSLLATLLLAVLALGVMPFQKGYAEIPDLPAGLKAETDNRMVLVDFYSPYCSTCLLMAPHVEQLAKKAAEKLLVRHIDVSDTINQHYMDTYKFDATPAYILFNPEGKAIYRMTEPVSPAILERQVLRTLNALDPVSFPEEFKLPAPSGLISKHGNGVILLAFDSPDCGSCKQMSPYLNGFQMTGQEGLHVLRVDTGSPAGKKLLKELSIPRLPAYVLLDNNQGSGAQRGELFRMVGEVPPKALWDLVRIFSESGV